MDNDRFDRLTRALRQRCSRRAVTRLLGGVATGTVLASAGFRAADAKKKKGKKHHGHSNKALCLSNGSHCQKKSKKCSAQHCLATPFSIEARWSNPATDHDTFLFVPQDLGSNVPAPFIDYSCLSDTGSAQHYPFAFVSQDATGPGDEVTTIAFLLDGTYEYWVELADLSPAGDLTVTLRNANGRVVRSWSSPQNATADDRGWHVFNIQGRTKSVTAIDDLINDTLPGGAHDPYTDACV